MFIKNIVLGVIGLILFPALYFVVNNPTFLIWGTIVSFTLILFYFVNVYVIGKTKSFLTISSSWIVIISLCIPLSTLSQGLLKTILFYAGTISISISWLMVLIELIVSETFKGY